VIHHLISEDEVLHKCVYCGKGLDTTNWKSDFHVRKHYKTVKCECGKDNQMTIRFFEGSGHDSWLAKKLKENPIDENIKKLKDNTIEEKVK
jgi:hypothetical protein